jgi:hypothetical protein
MGQVMKPTGLFFIVFGVIGLLFAYIIWNVGLLKPVYIETKQLPKSILVYKNVIGPYHKLSETFYEIENFAKTEGWECPKTFGLFYDDPNQAEQDRLRADIGCYLEASPLGSTGDLIIKEQPATTALVGSFDGAPWLTAFKVYGALQRESLKLNLRIKNGPVMEIYEPKGSQFITHVVFEIAE